MPSRAEHDGFRLAPVLRLLIAVFGFSSIFAAIHYLAQIDQLPNRHVGSVMPIQEPDPHPQIPATKPVTWQSGRFDPKRAFIHQAGDLGVGPARVQELVRAMKPVFDFRKAQPAHEWAFGFVDGQLNRFTLKVAIDEIYDVDLTSPEPIVHARNITVLTRSEVIRGEIRTCLFDALNHLRSGDRLAVKLSDVFAWDIDFYLDPRQGDRFDVLVEMQYVVNDQGMEFLDYGVIQAARYEARKKTFEAYLFEDNEGQPAYFNEKGQSLIRDVLRSPLRLTRVTSKFRHRRFHPVLKSNRPHNGVDYGAPRNTPVMAVAHGKIVRAGRYGSAGIAVEIAHKGAMLTQYFHLNKIAPGIRPGVRVKQGRTIGFVGKTGLATGYHLHFGMKINGRFVDPLKQKYEPGDPIPPEKMKPFKLHAKNLAEQLDADQTRAGFSSLPAEHEAIHGR